MTLICVTLGLLTLSTLYAALLSGLSFLAAIIVSLCLGIGGRQPSKSYWLTFAVVSLGIVVVGYGDNGNLATLRQALARYSSRPLYGFMHSETPEEYPQLYLYGAQVRESVYDTAGNYKGWAEVTAGQIERRGINITALPAVARYDEFALILVHAIAITIGWVAAGCAFTVRCRAFSDEH